jgi:superfamily II DNA helicase RecQ
LARRTPFCTLRAFAVYHGGDAHSWFTLIDGSDNIVEEERERQKAAVKEVAAYCQNNAVCRRVQVLRHFGQKFDAADCHRACDVCMADGEVVNEDLTNYAKDMLRVLQCLEESGPVSKTVCLDMFRGSGNKNMREKGHTNHPLFAIGKSMPKGRIDRLFDHLHDISAAEVYNKTNRKGYTNQYYRASHLDSFSDVYADWYASRSGRWGAISWPANLG